MKGLLYLIGLGPGDRAQRTFQAEEALERSAVIVGYQRYLALLGPRPVRQRIISSEISQEVDRAEQALDLAAAGKVVALVSGGDVGVYAMAGVVFEVLAKRGWQPGERLDIEVIRVATLGDHVSLLVDEQVALRIGEAEELLQDLVDLVNVVLVENEPALAEIVAIVAHPRNFLQMPLK